MVLLKSVPIPIDTKSDGIDLKLNLYSKGSLPNYRDDFPRTIVRVVGTEFTVTNLTNSPLIISKLYLAIIKEGKVLKFYSSQKLNKSDTPHLLENCQLVVNFKGNRIIDIFDNYKNEVGKMILYTNKGIIISEPFNGDKIEDELIRLNNDELDEYQNWSTKEFDTLNEDENLEQILSSFNSELRNELIN